MNCHFDKKRHLEKKNDGKVLNKKTHIFEELDFLLNSVQRGEDMESIKVTWL